MAGNSASIPCMGSGTTENVWLITHYHLIVLLAEIIQYCNDYLGHSSIVFVSLVVFENNIRVKVLLQVTPLHSSNVFSTRLYWGFLHIRDSLSKLHRSPETSSSAGGPGTTGQKASARRRQNNQDKIHLWNAWQLIPQRDTRKRAGSHLSFKDFHLSS